jgi:hypothetical protein
MLIVLGESPSIPGLFHAFDFSGHGFQLELGVGSVLSQLVADGKTDLPILAFHISRFARREPADPEIRQGKEPQDKGSTAFVAKSLTIRHQNREGKRHECIFQKFA